MLPDEGDHESLSGEHKVGDVGRYRLIAELARGGMGVVYLALVGGPGGFNKLFVVKVLKSHLAEDQRLVRMFLEEARLAAKLSHPNIVQTIEVGTDGGRHFIAMEFVDGQPYHRVIARGRRAGVPLPQRYHLYLLGRLLEGLQHAHEATDFDGTPLDLVHRDVSPHNVVLSYDGQVKVVDFGIAKALDTSSDTRSGMLKGKIAYMAPEQAAGERIDARADLFAVGVMLWEAVVGKRMWDPALNDMQMLHALVKGAIPRPRDAVPDLDAQLERIVLKATSELARDRYASAADMQADLEGYVKGLGAPPFGPRDLGKYVSDLFAQERAEIKAVIDGQLRALREATSGTHRTIDLPRLSPFAAPAGTPSGVQLASSSRDATEQAVTRVEGSWGSRRGTAVPAPRRSGRLAVAAVLLIGGAVAGAAALYGGRREPAPRTVDPSLPVTSTTPPPASAAAAPTPSTNAGAEAAAAAPPTAPAAPVTSAAHVAPRASAAAVQRGLPTASHGPAQSASPATPASAGHVRQQIDTNNPYGN